VRNPPFFIRVRDLSYLYLSEERSPAPRATRLAAGEVQRDEITFIPRIDFIVSSERSEGSRRSFDDRRE